MATLREREELKAALLSKGIEWDDNRLEMFIDSQNSNVKAANQSVRDVFPSSDTWAGKLPSTRIVGGPTPDPNPPLYKEDEEDLWGGSVGLGMSDAFLYGAEEPYAPPQEPRNMALDMVGNALWNFIDTASFGAAGYLQSKAGDDDPNRLDTLEDFLTGEEGPTTFAGRAGAGIGGLGGFILPMAGVKGATGAAVRVLNKF